MSNLNFPSNPNIGDTWTVGTKVYVWSGSAWLVSTTTGGVIQNFTASTVRVLSTTNAVSSTTGALIVDGGASIKKDLWIQGDIYKNGQLLELQDVSTASNIAFGGPGQILYQISTGTTGFIPTAPTGFILQANGNSAPSWIELSSVSAGSLLTATNLTNGGPGQIPYQEAPSSTKFIATGTQGFILQSNGTNAPSFVNPLDLGIGLANVTYNLRDGQQGSIPIQSASSTTAFIAPGTTGQLLQSQGSTASFVNTSTLIVGLATSSTRWTTARTITLDGDLNGSVSINGTTDVIFTATLKPHIVQLGVDTTGSYVESAYTYGYGITGSSTGSGTTLNIGINSTSSSSPESIVYRDLSGNFSANQITANSIIAVVTTATNLQNGTAGQIPYQTTSGVTSFFGPGNTGSVLVSYGTQSPIFQNTLTLAGNIDSSSTDSGTLQVIGGVGISGKIWAGSNIVSLSTANSTSSNTGAIVSYGGIGLEKDLTVKGKITVGIVETGTEVTVFSSNNVKYSSFTSPSTSTTSSVVIDSFNDSDLRTVKYLIQIIDNNKIHISELLLTHVNGTIFINEYAIVNNQGSLGSFDASINSNLISLFFNPSTATNMTIKLVKTGISP